MVLPSRQSLVKRLHCGRVVGEKPPVRGTSIERTVGHPEFATRCIAIWPELWFDGLGFPSGPAASPPRSRLWGVAALGQAFRPQVRELGSKRLGPGAWFEERAARWFA